MADEKLLSDFSYPASPGDYFPPIMGDPGGEEGPDAGSLIVPHVIHSFNDNNSSLVASFSTSELTILSTEIPAGQMEEGDVYSLRITGESFNNTGSAVTFRLRFKFNSVTELDTGARSIATSAEVRKWWIQVDMASTINPGQPGAVNISGIALCTATGFSESWATLGASESSVGSASGTASPQSRIPLDFSVQMGTASAAAYFSVSQGWHLLRFPHKH